MVPVSFSSVILDSFLTLAALPNLAVQFALWLSLEDGISDIRLMKYLLYVMISLQLNHEINYFH